MINHLPECERWYANMPEPDECPACEMFRACEQRVENRIIHGGLDTARFNAGLDAAREAVAAVPHGISWGRGLHIHRDRALAAIDALKEKS